MYSFAQRQDTAVIDEPLYAHYLRVSGADHPGKHDVLDAMDQDGDRVVRTVILGEYEKPILFMKQMAHHLVELDLSFLDRTANVLLIRDPEQMLPSLVNQLAMPTLRDTGLRRQAELMDQLLAIGQDPPILDARELVLDPEGVLDQLCGRLGIGFDSSMLRWNPGPREEDGVWARHWYHNVWTSTGFAPYRHKSDPFPEALRPLLDETRPYYEGLYERAIKARDTI